MCHPVVCKLGFSQNTALGVIESRFLAEQVVSSIELW